MVGMLLAICVSFLSIGGGDTPVEWEHGYKTDYVVATRYNVTEIGAYNIGFRLPNNPYDADRAEMYEWLGQNGVHVFQGGGASGAENYALVDGVTDKASANKFLIVFLPKYSKWVRKNLW